MLLQILLRYPISHDGKIMFRSHHTLFLFHSAHRRRSTHSFFVYQSTATFHSQSVSFTSRSARSFHLFHIQPFSITDFVSCFQRPNSCPSQFNIPSANYFFDASSSSTKLNVRTTDDLASALKACDLNVSLQLMPACSLLSVGKRAYKFYYKIGIVINS